MVRTVLVVMGAAFILLGLLGFALDNFLGAHLTPFHNIVHLVSGAASLFLGLKGSLSAGKIFAYAFGAVYFLLGVAGFAFGMTSTHSLPMEHADGGYNERMFRMIPGHFELGTIDHSLHLAIGLVFIIGAVLTRQTNLTRYMEGNSE